MLRICRAEDGHVFQVNATLRDIERTGSLESFLHSESDVEEAAIIAYLSDGKRLTNANIRELAGAQDQTIFVFNKYYLDFDLDEVLRLLHVEPPLQSTIEESIAATPPFKPPQLVASHLRIAQLHQEQIPPILQSLTLQHDAIRIASTSLDIHVSSVLDIFESLAQTSKKELEKQGMLLAGLDADLDIISRVNIHKDFMSPTARKAIEAGEKSRTLGDYVSNDKMKQVADTCARTHDDLRNRFREIETAVLSLREGTDAIRATVTDTRLVESAETVHRRIQELYHNIQDTGERLDSPNADIDSILRDLRNYDHSMRELIRSITDYKNLYTEQCILTLRRISVLNNDLIQLPPALSSLQASFRAKNSFAHIQRLHNMLYAYGATIIEIVRRKEFSRFFYQRAQSVLEVMAKLSVSERKRRQIYRSELHGQLPFETRGLDDPVPTIDFSPSRTSEISYSLERTDVDVLLRLLDDLEQVAQSDNDTMTLEAVKESRSGLDKLIVKMDGIESGFDRIAERSLLSASRLSSSRRRLSAADEQAFQQLAEQLRATEDSKVQQDILFKDEKSALQAEIRRLQSILQDNDSQATSECERADRAERELHQIRAQLESATMSRGIIQDRYTECLKESENHRKELEVALAHGTNQATVAERLKQELAQVRAEFEEVKGLEERNADKMEGLLQEQANTLRKLEEARARGEDLQVQIKMARGESDDLSRALKEAATDKDRLLRVQSTEHDRIIRDHIAEADSDRAVLEHQFSELKAVLESAQEQLKDARAEIEVAHSDAVGLREELQRVENELRDRRHTERLLRDDLNSARMTRFDLEQKLEDSTRLVAQILDVAIAFRNSHVKALSLSHAMLPQPGASTSGRQATSGNLGDSIFSTSAGYKPSPLHVSGMADADEPSPIDPTDPVLALDVLRAFDHDNFLEVITKTGSTIRKWQKQCKEYRERAKGKISFRNFTKGDLALFLPTRNSVSKPWAAFNVSFPHYFLQATGHLAEQLKTREWIVARITSIKERVVDHNEPDSNPYGLGDGVKYFMLEVEDWTQPGHQNKRKVSSKKVSAGTISAMPSPTNSQLQQSQEMFPASSPPEDILPLGPPQAEVEESFNETRPPTSHFFPVRARSNSSPNAGPSSLSRLLAQAPIETKLETIPSSPSELQQSPLPPTSPLSPPNRSGPSVVASSSTTSATATIAHAPNVPSPLRPGSRSSRISTSSKFSAGRLPTFGSPSGSSGLAKAPATTALTEENPLFSSSPSPIDGPPLPEDTTPSPQDSISEGMSNLWKNRRRTASQHVPRGKSTLGVGVASLSSSPPSATVTVSTNVAADTSAVTADATLSKGGSMATSTLANLANSWGVSFGRRRKTDISSSPTGRAPSTS